MDIFLKTRKDNELDEEDIYKTRNVGFGVYDQGIVTYKQNKPGLSAYYDKRYALTDGIHTRHLEFRHNTTMINTHHRYFITFFFYENDIKAKCVCFVQ